MKSKLFNLFLLSSSLLLPINYNLEHNDLSLTKTEVKKASILNYEKSLGIFADLTKDEVKNYYGNLESKTNINGDEFLSELQNIIKVNHAQISRSKAWASNWNLFTLLDRDYELSPLTEQEISSQKRETDNIYVNPLYTDKTIIKQGSIGSSFDREHCWPKSRGFKKRNATDKDEEKPYAATDMHNLRMAEKKNNSYGHNNDIYGTVADKNASTTSKVISQITNEVTGYRGLDRYGNTVYEPRDVDKGDIARSLFYMAARYHNFIEEETNQPALKLITFETKYDNNTIDCDATKTTPATYGNLEDLLEWNIIDPVDEYEIHRNNLVYNAVQYNRNPFIDYPMWADVAFKDKKLDLSSPNGVLGESYIDIDIDKKEYAIDDKIDLSDIKITFVDDDGSKSTISADSESVNKYILINGNKVPFTNEYVFESNGIYTLLVEYTVDGKTYSNEIKITVNKKASSSEEEDEITKFLEDNKQIIIIVLSVILLTIIVIIAVAGIVKKHKKKSKKKNKSNKKKK